MTDTYLPSSTGYSTPAPARIAGDGGSRAPCALVMPASSNPNAPRHSTKKGDGLEAALREYFRVSPDEELRAEDIATKFGHGLPHVYRVLRKLRQDGLVESAHIFRLKGAR